MPQRAIGVTDVASGAGVADYRTRERTVGGATVAEQYLIPILERVVSCRCAASTFMTVGVATVNTNLASLFNKTGSGVLVAVRRLGILDDQTGATSTIRSFGVTRITTAPTTGTLLTPAKFDTADTQNSLVEFRGATASDGGAATVLTATPGTDRAKLQMVLRAPSIVDQFVQDEMDLLPRLVAGEPVILREGQGLLVTGLEAQSSAARFIVNVAWGEFTLP